MNVNLKSLIEKLNTLTRKTLEDTLGLAVARTHYNMEPEHFLLKLLERRDGDLSYILDYFEVNRSILEIRLVRTMDQFKTGNGTPPSMSPRLLKLLKEAWTIGSVDYGASQIRSGFAILALVCDDELVRFAGDISQDLAKIAPNILRRDFGRIVAGSSEEVAGRVTLNAPVGKQVSSQSPNLDEYTIDLTANARAGMIDPVLGRDAEIRQIIDILMRRRQNNPILTGEAGVGKTAVVEGFALRVANGDVPAPLKKIVVRALDLALLQAGAGVKGEFENRLKGLIAEVKNSAVPIVLIIDEAHTMIGAGGQAGQNDAANLLKPALARGELRTVAATTWSEYKKYFEKDPALARRFQVVKVEEPDEEQCQVMLRGICQSLEQHHNVRILDEGLAAAVMLSHRYLAGRQLPDKAVSVLDTACARLALKQDTVPPVLEDLTRQLDDLEVQQRILRREEATGADHAEQLDNLTKQRIDLSEKRQTLEQNWQQVKSLVQEIREIRAKLEQSPHVDVVTEVPASLSVAASSAGSQTGSVMAPAAVDGQIDLRSKLNALTAELSQVQGDEPLTQVCVDAHLVGQVISSWTGIPLGKMIKDEISLILSLDRRLASRVIGQDHALALISQRIQTGRARLEDPGKPAGIFLLAGPSGVGKTETALALADLLYGGEQNLITINMSEFQEPHSISTLKGSPPGYVGFGEGGVLTEAVRRRPYSVVLLDEIEKAHPDVRELFYQVFDRGMMEDGEGRGIDFKNTIILLTTNAGTDELMELCADAQSLPEPEMLLRALKPTLNEIFKPAFLGRMVIVPYYPVRDEVLNQIVSLKLSKIKRRIQENHKIDLRYGSEVIAEIARRCTEVESGARNADHILTNTLLPEVSRRVLGSMAAGEAIKHLTVSLNGNGSFQYV